MPTGCRGGASATDIEQGFDVESGPLGSSTSETITMVVPDGVAQITLHYAPGPDNGSTRIASLHAAFRAKRNGVSLRRPHPRETAGRFAWSRL